jgi:hypothetical protein
VESIAMQLRKTVKKYIFEPLKNSDFLKTNAGAKVHQPEMDSLERGVRKGSDISPKK